MADIKCSMASRVLTAWWCVGLLLGRLPLSHAEVLLNEIHYDPPDPTDPVEFIELFNSGTAPVSLAGWRIERGVDFTFPEQVLPAGGYLVVAQDPVALKRKFGVDALGPWTGNLSREGEVVRLRDAVGTLVDEVDYRLGFPWPTVGEPPGFSIELMNPQLDNALGGSWRASVAGGGGATSESTLVPEGSAWRFWRGRSEPSSPTTAWRQPEFTDASWETGTLPIGYDPGLAIATRLDDMRGQYASVYLRRSFAVAEPEAISALRLEAVYDDGFRVWINGQEVFSSNLPLGDVPFDGTSGPARESNDPETFEAGIPPGLLRTTGNVLAVQAHNSSLNASSDFFFDARLTGVKGPVGQGPSPGRRNLAFSTNAPPALRQIEHSPVRPRSGETVRVQAKVSDPEGVASVTLETQVVEPGAYLELTDAEYETRWTPTSMRDDGTGGDAVAGDGIYTATVPGDTQRHRRLVRYRVRAVDALGAAVRAPYADDPQPNFAYFVYDGVPAWTGAVRPGVPGDLGRVFTVGEIEMNRLPVLHLLAKRQSVEESTWLTRYGGDAYPWRGTLVFNERVYDHVQYRARGGVWRYAMTKNMWKFDFLRGHDFAPVDDWGRRLAVDWTKLNLGASIQQGDYAHRGEQGLFESVGFRVFRLAGVPAVNSAYTQFRIIDDVEEAPAGDQYNGDFWGVYLMLEQPDGRFLRQHDLADANLYKMEGGTGELNNLGPAGPTDKSDLQAFQSGMNSEGEDWWRTRFNVPNYLSYQTVVQAIHHYDICYDKNYFYYLEPGTRRWQVIPWDLDLTWAENMYDAGCGGVDRVKAALLPNAERFPRVWREWQNRIREFRDLLWNQDEAARLIDEQVGRLRGPADGPTLLDADRAQWDYNPRMTDARYSTAPESKAGWGRYYKWPNYPASVASRDFAGGVQLMKRYVGFRGTNAAAQPRSLDSLAADAAIPSRPALTYSGAEGYPVNGLRFRSSAYQGSSGFGFQRWRIGEVTRPVAGSWVATEPWRYEIEPVWESGALNSFASEIAVPAEALRVGGVYRARVQFEDAEGRTSSWSEPVEFAAGASTAAASLASDLAVTELMFNATGGSTNDFIELHNRGTATLSLGGVRFTQGIDYAIPAGTTLAPGGYLLVVKAAATGNFAAFRSYYGLATSVPIVGPYSGNFSDAGETVSLTDAAGGQVLISFTYGDGRGWPWVADGSGHSLVPRSDFATGASGALDFGGNWRASTFLRGSPGTADPEPDTTLVINEVVAHTDFLSEDDSNDWVELYNRGTIAMTLGRYWYLSDDPGNLKKWEIPATTQIPGRGWFVFDEVTGFNNPRGSGFSINKAGEQILLSHFPSGARGGVVDAIRFKGQENEWSMARVPDGGEFWDPVIPRTRGFANAALLPRGVISELMFHAGGAATNQLAADLLEFIELHNPTSQGLPLFNTNAVWRLNGGVEYEFPLFTTLGAGERAVVVSFDPKTNATALARFRSAYQIPATVRIFGPYTGVMNNDTDRVALERAQSPDVAGDPISWVIVDEVLYFDRAPWPNGADGTGQSLHRNSATVPGSDPESWTVGSPTPGAGAPVVDLDADDDGMPDAWEIAHGFDPQSKADANLDADADGLTNLAEYLAGTDPRDAESVLRLRDVHQAADGTLAGVFRAEAGRSYVLEQRAVGSSDWSEGATFGPATSAGDRKVVVTVTAASDAQGPVAWLFRIKLR